MTFDDQSVRAMIAKASSNADPMEAVREIDMIWNELLSCTAMAEARMRILVARMDKPVLAYRPEWFSEQVPALHEDGSIDEATIHCVRDLICAVAHTVNNMPAAEITPDAFGCVQVAWSEQRLYWIVAPPRLRWPGVDVRAYEEKPGTGVLGAETFHHAAGVIRHAKLALERS